MIICTKIPIFKKKLSNNVVSFVVEFDDANIIVLKTIYMFKTLGGLILYFTQFFFQCQLENFKLISLILTLFNEWKKLIEIRRKSYAARRANFRSGDFRTKNILNSLTRARAIYKVSFSIVFRFRTKYCVCFTTMCVYFLFFFLICSLFRVERACSDDVDVRFFHVANCIIWLVSALSDVVFS